MTKRSRHRSSSAPAGISARSRGTCGVRGHVAPVVARKRSFDRTAEAGAQPAAGAVLLPRLRGLRLVRAEGRLSQRRHRPARQPGLLDPRQKLCRAPRSERQVEAPGHRSNGAATPTLRQAWERGRSSAGNDDRRRRRGARVPESGEGIHPAIASGRLAAETLVAAHGRHAAEDLHRTPTRSAGSTRPRDVLRLPFAPPARQSADCCSGLRSSRGTYCSTAGSCARNLERPITRRPAQVLRAYRYLAPGTPGKQSRFANLIELVRETSVRFPSAGPDPWTGRESRRSSTGRAF